MSKLLPLPPQDYLHECLRYDAGTGKLYWKERPLRHFYNEAAWKSWTSHYALKPAFYSVDSNGYLVGRLDSIRYAAHRIIFKMLHNKEPSHIDHDDRNRQNNRELNLKASDAEKNAQNRTKRTDNKSGVTGVSYDSRDKVWRARVGHKIIGRFKEFDDAVEARAKALANSAYHPTHGT